MPHSISTLPLATASSRSPASSGVHSILSVAEPELLLDRRGDARAQLDAVAAHRAVALPEREWRARCCDSRGGSTPSLRKSVQRAHRLGCGKRGAQAPGARHTAVQSWTGPAPRRLDIVLPTDGEPAGWRVADGPAGAAKSSTRQRRYDSARSPSTGVSDNPRPPAPCREHQYDHPVYMTIIEQEQYCRSSGRPAISGDDAAAQSVTE